MSQLAPEDLHWRPRRLRELMLRERLLLLRRHEPGWIEYPEDFGMPGSGERTASSASSLSVFGAKSSSILWWQPRPLESRMEVRA